MIISMTGYGISTFENEDYSFSVEIRSVNNRYFDCSVHLPKTMLYLEDSMRTLLQSRVNRGKVDVYLSFRQTGASAQTVTVNLSLAEQYRNALKTVSESLGLSDDPSALAIGRFPDVFTVENAEPDRDGLKADVLNTLSAALDVFDEMRAREGEHLASSISDGLERIEGLVGDVERLSPASLEKYRNRLLSKMKDLLGSTSIDEQRILLEAGIYADKISVDEETVRLRSHIRQMRGMLENGSPIGKKMDFLVQEFNRESNTIGSKCSDCDVTEKVVSLKNEIEKIREQIQNIE